MEEDSPIMSSSLHFADDFLRTEIEQEQTQQLHESIQQSFPDLANEPVDVGTEGLQVLTRVIDKMLAKIKVEIIDTVICIIHTSAVPLAADHQDDTEREYALEIRVPKISYFDETPEFNQPAPSSSSPSNDARRMADSSVFLPPVANETIKIITAVAPTIWLKSTQKDIDSTSLFYSLPSKSETTIRSKRSIDDDLSETEFYEANEGSSTFFRQDLMQSSFMSGATTPRAYMRSSSTLHKPYEALLFTTMDKDNWVRLKLRPSIDSVFSIKQLDFLVTHVRTMLTPLQMAFIVDLLDSTVDTTKPPNITPVPMPAPMRPSASSTSSIYSSSPNILDDLDRLVTEPPRPKKESIPQPREMSIPGCKIKIQVSLVEFFLLYKDQHKIPNDEWADPTLQPEKEKDHIRFAVNHLIIRLQQFPQEDPKNKRRDSYSNTSNVLPVTSTIDVGISNIHFDEWILKPNMTPSASMYYGSSSSVFSDQTRCQTQYNKYTPIFEFDPTIKNAYPSDELFPSYGSSSKTWLPDKSEMVRIRLEKRQAHEFSRFVDGK
jgi:hypothetical protein